MTRVPRIGERSTEIGPLLDAGEWTGFQKSVLAMVALAVLFDGFDNQALGFAIPLLVRDWGVARGDFAPIFALGFAGMAIGTALGGVLGDRLGRRPLMVGSVLLFGCATFASAFSNGLGMLGACRAIAGLGLGAAMPNATALIAEFTPVHRRSAAVTLGIVCIPLGGVVGGLIAAWSLPIHGWRPLLGVGGAAPVLLAAVLWSQLPESPRILARRPESQAKLARLMFRLGHYRATRYVDSGDVPGADRGSGGIARLFDRRYLRDTLAIWTAFFFCILTTYIVFSWAPTLLSSTGFGIAVASSGLAVFNVGGVLGAVAGGFAIQRYGSRATMLTLTAIGIATAALLASMPIYQMGGTALLMAVLGVAGAAINGVQTTLYALAAHVYPVAFRATGVGSTAAVGRLGAIASSFVGAAVVAGGASAFFGTIVVTMSVVLLALIALRRHAPATGPAVVGRER